jgi:integrase
LEAPAPDTLKGVRNRAILAALLYHGIRREELCLLRLRDLQSRQGVMHFRIKGKRDKIRFIPVDPMTLRLSFACKSIGVSFFFARSMTRRG